MNRLEYTKEQIRQQVTIRQVVERYTDKKIVKGVCNCPLHHEKTASFKIDEVKQLYYCFGCGKGGDVFKFVQEYFGMEFKDALYKLDQDFSLGITGQRISVKAQIEARERKKQRALELKAKEEKEREYSKLCTQYVLINNLLSVLEPMTSIWGSTLTKKAYMEYELDRLLNEIAEG